MMAASTTATVDELYELSIKLQELRPLAVGAEVCIDGRPFTDHIDVLLRHIAIVMQCEHEREEEHRSAIALAQSQSQSQRGMAKR
jgi:hypothetical protein